MRTEGSYDIGKLTANRNCEKRLFNKFWGGNPIASAVGAVKYEIPTDLHEYGYFLVTMEDSEFKIGCEKVTYFLWINEKSGLIMNAKDTHTIYTLSESSTKQVNELILEFKI